MHGVVDQFTQLLVAQAEGGAQGGLGQMLVPFMLMMAILYFIVIRPQTKERKRHDDMLTALKRGDEVITSSGILGSVTDIDKRFLTLEIARNVKIRVLKSAVAKKHVEEQEKSGEGATEEKS